jgi:hypothetical protein
MFRRLAFSASRRLLRTLLRPPCSDHRFDSAFIALRSAPFADCSAPGALRRAARGLLHARHFRASRRFRIAPSSTLDAPCRSQISLRSTLYTPHPSRIAPLPVLDASVQVYGSRRTQTLHAPAACMDFSVPAAFAPRRHRSLCARHLMRLRLMDISMFLFRILRCSRMPPRTALRVLHRIRSAASSILITPHRMWITPRTTPGTLLRLQIAPHSSLSALC